MEQQVETTMTDSDNTTSDVTKQKESENNVIYELTHLITFATRRRIGKGI